MATNIEQIFRSFVVNKFKEIQEENRNSENMDSSHNGELAAPGTEDAPEGSAILTQNEGNSQNVTRTEETESTPMEIVTSQNIVAEEKEGESKDLKTTDLSSDDEVKKDSSKKKSKKHKKHKSKKKKKKKKKEKNEKRSKSTSSVEDQDNASSESKSAWQQVIASPREQDTSNTLSSQVDENVDALPSLGGQDLNSVDSTREQSAKPQLDIDSGFFGPKCPNEMHFTGSSNLTVCEAEMPESSKELAVDIQQTIGNNKFTDLDNEKQHTNCETADALQNEISLPQPDLVLSEGKSVELRESRIESEENKEQSESVSSPLLQPESKTTSTSLSKLTAKSRSRSNSLARKSRSRSKSMTKVPKKQASSKSLTRQRSRSSSVVRRRRSRSSSVGQRRRSKSKSPVRRRRSRSSTSARYSKSPMRSWWSKSIRNRQRSVSIERKRRSRTRSPAKRRRTRSRSSEKRQLRTRSSAKRIRSRSRSANRRRKSRSTSRKHRLRSRSASRRKSKSPSKSSSPSRKRKSKSASPLRRQKSKSSSPVRRGRTRSHSAVQKHRSRSGDAASRRLRSRSASGSRRRRSRSGSFTRRRRSRSSVAFRRRKSRSGSAFRRRRSRSAVTSRRQKSRSPSISRRRRSKSPSVSRRRRSRSTSPTRRRKSRSTSASRRRRSRSASRRRRSRSASRRRRSRSASKRRRSRSTSASRRRRSRSNSRKRRSRSTSRRRRSRSASRRRRSRSAIASRRQRTRSASRRRKSRSASRRRKSRSASRRRRSRSDSASRRRRSRSDSRRQRSRFGSISRRRKSRSSSDTRRRSPEKSRSYSATKRKSRSTSVSRGEQSTLSSSGSKLQSRRSRSKEENRKSRSRSASVKLKSVESEPTMQSKSTEPSQLEAVSYDKQLTLSASTVESVVPDVSTVEKNDNIKLPDTSSALMTELKSSSSPLETSSSGAVLIPCTENAVEVESAHLDCPNEPIISTDIPDYENSSECDMDIEPVPFTPIQTACAEQSLEGVNLVETSKEEFEFQSTDSKPHANFADLRHEGEPTQKTLGGSAEEGSSPFSGQTHGLSQLATEYITPEFCDQKSVVVHLEDPADPSCQEKYESKPEFANTFSDSVCKTTLKTGEFSAGHIATSSDLTWSGIAPLANCVESRQDSESIKCVKDTETDVLQKRCPTERNSTSSAVSDHSSLTVEQDIPTLRLESQVERLHGSSTGKSQVASNNEMVLCDKTENVMTSNLMSNKGQNVPVPGCPSNAFSGSQKHTKDVSSRMLNDHFSHKGGIPNFTSTTLDEDNSVIRSETKDVPEAALDLQRTELKFVKNNTVAHEQSFFSSLEQSSSNETENVSASSCATERNVTDNTTYKHVTNDYNFKDSGESEVLHPVENKTVEVKRVKENQQTLPISEVIRSHVETKLQEFSSYEVTLQDTSQTLEVEKQNVHRLMKGDDSESNSTSIEKKSDPETTFQNSSVTPNIDYYENSRSKEATTKNVNLTAYVSPTKRSSSTKMSDSSAEKNLQGMSVSSAEVVKKDMLLSEDKMEVQKQYQVLSNTNSIESYSESKISSKTSSLNDGYKQEVDKVSYGAAAQMKSSKYDVLGHFEKTSASREQSSSSVLPREKQGSSSSIHNDGKPESMQLVTEASELSKTIDGHAVSNKEATGESSVGDSIPKRDFKSVLVSKDSENNCLPNSTDDKIHVNDNSNVKSQPSSSNLSIQPELIPKNKERVNLEKESTFQPLIDVPQPELKTQEQSAPNYSKPEPAYIGLRETKPQEDSKLSPKTFLNETGRLSVSSMPFQFKFVKTFKTLGVSQLCSTSEDSSDVEISKVNNSSSGTRNTTVPASGTSRSSSKTLPDLQTTQHKANDGVEPSKSESSQDISNELSQSDHRSGQLSEKDLSQSDNLQGTDDSQTGSNAKFPHISNAVSKLGVKQRQYRSRSVAQDSRTPSVDRGHASRSRSKSLSRRRRSKSKSSSRKKRSSSTARKKSSHSKSVRKKRSRSRSRGRKGRSQSKSKGKKKRSTSKLSGKRKRSRSKSSERIGGSKSSGKQRSSRSTSKTRKGRLSKSPEKKGRSRSKSESRKNLHSKTASTRKRSRSKSPNRRRKSRSKSLSSRSRSRSVSASWKHFSHSKSSIHRKRSRSSSRSASPRRRSRSRNKRRSFSRSPAARSNSRSRSRWQRSRSRGRWRRSRSLSASRRRSRSTSKKRKSLSPVRRRRSRSQIKQKDKSPVSKRKSSSPQPPPPPPPLQKKSVLSKPAGFKHSIGLKSLIQKQLSQAKSQGSTGKLSKEQIPLPSITNRTQLSLFSARSQASVSNLSSIGQIPVPNLAEVPLPSVSAGSQIPMPSVPPAEPLSVSSLAAETQLSVPDLTSANQWHVPDMTSGTPWSVPDIAAGTQWSMADLGAGTQWPMSDLTAASHWPMHDMSVGAQWSMPDLAAGTQWAVPDVATGAQWAVPDLAHGTQWTVPDLHAGSQWAMTNLAAGAQWAVPDLAAQAQWAVPDLTAGAQIQRADLAPEAQVPGSDLAPEAQVPGSDLAAEAQVPGSDLAAEAQVPGSDMVAEAQVPLEHDLTLEDHNVMPDVAAEALVPVASSTVVPDVASGIPLPDVAAAAAQMPVPDVAATIHMPDVATEAQKHMSDFVATHAYMSLKPDMSVEESQFEEPVLPSEHKIESNAFEQQSSFESSVNTSLNLKMEEETLSSGQQVPQNSFENSQSELSDKIISADKHDQVPETDVLLNAPQVEPTMDSESHLSSETCRSSDVPFASCERSDFSVQSISVEPLKEHGLFDAHKNVDTPLQYEPHAASNFSAESQTESVEPNGGRDHPLLTEKNLMSDSNVQVEQHKDSDHTLMGEPPETTWVAPENEPLTSSNTILDINSRSISDEVEACVPNHSQQVELNPSQNLPHPEHPLIVEPYISPDRPHLVEPYTSPVHPQLVEPYLSPPHPPMVELYSSPERPQLVEPYASPDFPQIVEPYASPDRQQLVEPYTDTQICQPCTSPVLTENTCSHAEKHEDCSISDHILTHEAVTCTLINTDSSCSEDTEVKNDFSQLPEYSVSDIPKKQDTIIDTDYPQLSDSNNASLQEVPCPSPVKASSLEGSSSPKESSAEECSPTEGQSVELCIESHLEQPSVPVQLLTKPLQSPHRLNQDEPITITDYEPLSSYRSPDQPKLDSSSFTTDQQVLDTECVTDVQSKSNELCSTKGDMLSHKDLSAEQVQENLYSTPVQPSEDFPSPSAPSTNESCLNAANAQFTESEQSSAEDQQSHPGNNLCIPILSNTIINLQGVELSSSIMPLPDRPEQETITEQSHSEESKSTSGSGFPDELPGSQVDKLLDKPSSLDLFHDSQDNCPSPLQKGSDCSNSYLPEHSSNAGHSLPSEYSTKANQILDPMFEIDTPNTEVSQSQELSLDVIDNPLSTENVSFPADLPSSNKDKLQCLTSTQDSDLSVECMKDNLQDAAECVKIDNHFTTTPPDLLPYDSDQPTDMCSEPSSEPVPFNSQPPPELLPYDSEQPANSFLSISDYSAEQGSSDFHAPPELLPYDSDQPIVLHNQETEPSAEEPTIYPSTTIHRETYKDVGPPSMNSEENCSNIVSLEVPDKCESSNKTETPQKVFSKSAVIEFTSTEPTHPSETLQEQSLPSAEAYTQEDQSSSKSSVDKYLPAEQSEEIELPVVQTVLGSEISEHLLLKGESQTEQTDISDTPEVQCTSSYELVTTSESEAASVLPLPDETSLETSRKDLPPMPLMNAECPQPQPISRETDPISDLESRREHSRSRSIERKKSRSKSLTPKKRSHSKSVVRSKRSRSRSASTGSNRRSPSVVKSKESTHVIHKRSSRSASLGHRRRSRSISASPKKRSRSRQRHSRSPSKFRRQSRSPSVTSRRRSSSVTRRKRSRSSSATRKRRSPSSSVTRKKSSPSPATRRRRSPSPARRRRSPSPPSRRRRTPSPSVSRRRRSPSATRRRRSRSPSTTRRRRSPSPSATRRRRSPSPSATRRRRSPSPSATRRRRSPSPSATRRRRSPSATTRRRRSPSSSATRRRRSPSPSASRRRRSPSSSEFRRKRSPSQSHKRQSHSPSVPSASRRRRSQSASQRKRSRSPSAPRKRRSKSKSASKSPSDIKSKSDRSRSHSQSEVSRKRKTRSRSSSRDKKTVEKRRKRSSSKDSSKDYYSAKQRRKSRTPPRRKKSRSPVRRASVCKSPVRRRRSRSPVRRKSFSRSPIRRKRSRSRDKSMDSARSPKRLTDLDKAQLLEIAKANAAAMCAKAGVPLPPSLKPAMTPATPVEEKITHRTYGVTIQELTEKCKQIAQSKEDDVIVNKPHDSDDEEEDRPFYNHPFKVSEHKPISFSLLNPSLKPAPKTQVTLTKEFPVSSGSQHRKKESDKVYGEWVPVENKEESKDDVFTNTGPAQPVDITSAMNERAVAQTRLTGNPYDIEALYMLNRAQEQIDAWAQSTSIPGQFTGSTGAQVLSAEEISNSGPQAWLKKVHVKQAEVWAWTMLMLRTWPALASSRLLVHVPSAIATWLQSHKPPQNETKKIAFFFASLPILFHFGLVL